MHNKWARPREKDGEGPYVHVKNNYDHSRLICGHLR